MAKKNKKSKTATKKLTAKQLHDRKLLRAGLDLGDDWILRLTPMEELGIDHSYQRSIVPATVEHIATNFNPDAVGVIKSAIRRRTLKNIVTDGQNRFEGIKIRTERGYTDVPTELLCLTKLNTTRAMEARIFVDENTCRPVTGNARFRARLEYGSQPETLIKDWVEAVGYSLEFLSKGRAAEVDKQPAGIRSVATLLRCYGSCREYLQPALKFLKYAAGNTGRRYSTEAVPYELRTGNMVFAIAYFLKQQGTKDVRAIANTYRDRHLDMSAAWKEVQGLGYNRYQVFADWLEGILGNGIIQFRRAA